MFRLNTLRPRQDGRHFPNDIFKWIFLNESIWISIKISLTFVPSVPINNIPALVQIMAWRRPGDKSLSEPMMVSLPTHICVTRPQWVNHCYTVFNIMLCRTVFNSFELYDFPAKCYVLWLEGWRIRIWKTKVHQIYPNMSSISIDQTNQLTCISFLSVWTRRLGLMNRKGDFQYK